MQIFRLSSFPIEQVGDLERLERALAGWFVGNSYPARLLAISRRFDMRPAIERVLHDRADLDRLHQLTAPLLRAIDRAVEGAPGVTPEQLVDGMADQPRALLGQLCAHAPALRQLLDEHQRVEPAARLPLWGALGDAIDALLWRRPWTQEIVRFYQALQQRHLRSTSYYLIVWSPPDVSARALQATLRQTTGRGVEPVERLPSVLDGPYTEELQRLRPEQLGDPWMAALLSYDMRGAWDATTLHHLLDANFDVAIAIDIATLTRGHAMRSAEMAYNAARIVARDAQVVDMRAGRVIAAAEHVMHALAHENLHTVQIGVLVGGATEAELEVHVAETRARLGTQLQLLRPDGAQGEALKLWSPTPRGQIDAPLRPRTMLSHGVGCCMGLLGYHQASATEGVFWGMDSRRRSPLFFDLFQGNQAAHMVVLGKSGHGKTFYLNVLALRAAALSGYRVIGLDAFNNGGRIAAAARAGARCHYLGLETPINILDVIYDSDDAGGDWVAAQAQHVIGQLALLLGTPTTTADRRSFFLPRHFSIAERGVLDRVLTQLYLEVGQAARPEEVPVLTDLIALLEHQRVREGHALARDMRLLLFGTDEPGAAELTNIGRSFNAPTGLDWTFGADINYYDFERIPEQWRPFYYVQAISAILRFMRDPRRDRSRATLLQIDEFGYLTQVEELARLAATICKVARKYRIGLVAIDQNPITFLGNDNGRFIFENAAAKMLFHLDDLPARQMGEAIADLTPEHLEFLSHAGVGHALAVVGNDVYTMTVEANPKELRALQGS